MKYTKLEKPDATGPKQTVCECIHCGERSGVGVGKCPLTCKNCKTEKGRNDICNENLRIFEKAGLEYHCSHCGL